MNVDRLQSAALIGIPCQFDFIAVHISVCVKSRSTAAIVAVISGWLFRGGCCRVTQCESTPNPSTNSLILFKNSGVLSSR